MKNYSDKQKLALLFSVAVVLLLAGAVLRYLWLDVSEQGKIRQNQQILEYSLIPALRGNPYQFIQKGNLVRSKDRIQAGFIYSYDADIDGLLSNYQKYIQVHQFDMEYLYDSLLDKYTVHIYSGGLLRASLDLYRGEKSYAGRIAIIIDDFGYRWDAVIKGFIDLRPFIDFSVIPGHQYSKVTSQTAWDTGHEILIHMPMEAIKSYGEQEKVFIGTKMRYDEIWRAVDFAVKENSLAVGMNNHMGSKATSDERTMKYLAKCLQKQNLFFVDSYTSAESVGMDIMQKFHIPTARRQIFIDNERQVDETLHQLNKLITIALDEGVAIGIGHCAPTTLEALHQFLPMLEEANIALIPVSQLVH